MKTLKPHSLTSIKLRDLESVESGRSRAPIEHLVELLLTGSATGCDTPPGIDELAEEVLRFDTSQTKVVILGGGTGLSTVVGGNSQSSDWADRAFVGLKQEFPELDIIVCTTDDGGSTGLLLRELPIIGIGDLRKLLVSSSLATNLKRAYNVSDPQIPELTRIIQHIFHYRFQDGTGEISLLKDPVLTLPSDLRAGCPRRLTTDLRRLGAYVAPKGQGPVFNPSGHCLGNLLLTSAIFMAASGKTSHHPGLRELRAGLDEISRLTGSTPGHIHPATSTPGQLKFRYANGVEVYGQSKSASARRGFPVDRVTAEFLGAPRVSAAVCRVIAGADLIIYAPGSLYTSIIPILQVQPIVDAIRSNQGALKILGANSWIQQGETDISLRNQGRGFRVSELIEAYDRNVPGGAEGLFNIVLSANLEHLPGNILRNYALEGKIPIHMDRFRVEAMGFQPVEATLFALETEEQGKSLYHDARRFALAIRTLLYARSYLKDKDSLLTGPRLKPRRHAGDRHPMPVCNIPTRHGRARSLPICNYLKSVKQALSRKRFQPQGLRKELLELTWDNRDIRLSHLDYFRGARIIPPEAWNRSTAWDNVAGYYDPDDQFIKIHEDLLTEPDRLRSDLMIALGESLLGQYIESRRWIDKTDMAARGAKCYQILLRRPDDRNCFLSDSQLHAYLILARMTPDHENQRVYRITINDNEGFIPPGLLFGLTYAWYLSNSYGGIMEYEMNLLRWPEESLIPHQAEERLRKQALVTFFRKEVFGHDR